MSELIVETPHKIGTREEWLSARLELLKDEKELTRRADELAAKRRELPWVRVNKEYPLRSWEKLTFEYVLLKDVNDTDSDARRVAALLANLNCKVNLIALNPGPGIAFETPSPERVASFQTILKRAFPCFVRKPRGRDIYAACGQLKRVVTAAP